MPEELIIADMVPQTRVTMVSQDEIKALAESIHENGLQFPILVHRPTGKVIDGLARIEATRLTGRARIAADFATTLEEVADNLQAIRLAKFGPTGHEPLERIVELLEDANDAKDMSIQLNRAARKKGQMSADENLTRSVSARAYGIHGAAIEVLWSLITSARSGDVFANELLADVMAGKQGVFTAKEKFRQVRKTRQVGFTLPEAKSILEVGGRNLVSLGEQILSASVFAKQMTLQEVEAAKKLLLQQRNQINRAIRNFREERKTK